jgi:hypothetical protein
MIRSCRIPNLLQRICDYNENNGGIIHTAILCTADGELLGSTASAFVNPVATPTPGSASSTTSFPKVESLESFGTLVADIAVDYARLGDEYASLELGHPVDDRSLSSREMGGNEQMIHQHGQSKRNTLQCLFLELELGIIGVSACPGVDCLVIAIAAPDAQLGSVKARLQTIAMYVTEALSPLTDMSYG